MNEKIKRYAKANGVPQWKICEVLNISEPTFSRHLRKPLSTSKEKQIISIIKEISENA